MFSAVSAVDCSVEALPSLSSTSKTAKWSKKKKNKETEKEKRWQWTDEMTGALVQCLLEFKQSEEEEGLDFEGDLVRLYAEVRTALAKKFNDQDFGPVSVTLESTEDKTKE